MGEADPALPIGSVFATLGWRATVVRDSRFAVELLHRDRFDLLAVLPTAVEASRGGVRRLIELASDRRVATVLIGSATDSPADAAFPMVTYLPDRLTPDELRGRLATIDQYRGMMAALEREVDRMQQLATRLQTHVQALDDELQLAGRLQRALLPDLSRSLHGTRFASLYRPASQVSGDVFDVFPVGESHTALYLADAVGHGMAAGLLTVFMKRAIAQHHADAGSDSVSDPSAVLTLLNRALLERQLPGCEFVTACYGVLDHEEQVLTLARAGHPYPIRLSAGGSTELMDVSGCLLGVSADATFEQRRYKLAPGDRVILYTDGLEAALDRLGAGRGGDAPGVCALFQALADSALSDLLTGIDELLVRLGSAEDDGDDVTILAFETPHGD